MFDGDIDVPPGLNLGQSNGGALLMLLIDRGKQSSLTFFTLQKISQTL